jgi:hypothetical protein
MCLHGRAAQHFTHPPCMNLSFAPLQTASLQTDEYPPGHTVLDEVICRGRMGVLSLELSKYPQALKKLSRCCCVRRAPPG